MPATSSLRVRRSRLGAAETIVLENNRIRVTACPANGGAIIGFEDLGRGVDVMWRNPLLPPPRNQMSTQPVTGYTDLYDVLDGSWFVSMPTGFFPTNYFGAPLGAHGEMRSVPFEFEILEEGADVLRVKLTGRSVRTPFVLERTWVLRNDSAVLEWDETLVNRSTRERPCAWLQHPAFSGVLIEGAELRTRAKTIETYNFNRPVGTQIKQGYKGPWPHIPLADGSGTRDCSIVPRAGSKLDHSVQMSEFDIGWGCVWNPARRFGFAMRWDEKLFPWAWTWACANGIPDYPMWGQGHLVTLQPSTSPIAEFPELVSAGQVARVPANGSIRTRWLSGFTEDPDKPWDLPTARS